MKKIILKLILTFFILITPYQLFADDVLEDIKYTSSVEVGEIFKLDLSNIKKSLEEKYNTDIEIEWNVKGFSSIIGDKYDNKFEKSGEKEIKITIYKIEEIDGEENRKYIADKDIKIFVYNKYLSILVDSEINLEDVVNLTDNAKALGTYLEVKTIEEKNISTEKILNFINYEDEVIKNKSDYIGIWGEKDFILSILSKINNEIENGKKLQAINIVAITPININVLRSYLNNFISNKVWIKDIILINDLSKGQIIKNTSSIDMLEYDLGNNQYEYIKINSKFKIHNLLFVSKFINNLSNRGFSIEDIYIVILIPFLFTLISIFKHFIGLSPVGITIPIFVTILFLKIGFFSTIILLFTIIFTNLLLSKLIGKYNLLYTPKISFLVIINLVTVLLTINILFEYEMLNVNINDIILIILLVIISERLISIMISKEFKEYRSNLVNTILFAIISFFIFNIQFVQIFILAFPEIILLLIPINFLIGRFNGLRITEYFRFKEVIKNIEEE